MKHNVRIVFFVWFHALLCVSVNASNQEKYVQEEGDIIPLDVCAVSTYILVMVRLVFDIDTRGGLVYDLRIPDIVGPTWNITKPWMSPCPTLVVWVPKKAASFAEFVKLNKDNQVKGGFSIAIFCYALQELPFNVRPIFKPFINSTGQMNGTYDQLLRHIEGQTCQAVAGDITITGSRAQYVSFTIPYLKADVYMLVLSTQEWKQNLWAFLKPFTTNLWISIVCACLFVGIGLAILEYRAENPKFLGPIYSQLIMIVWFPISTFFFQDGKILNRCSKVLLIMWLCMIFIVLQIYTATLSSWLTLNQLNPKIPTSFENVGYQTGSFIDNFITQRYNSSGKNLQPLSSYQEYKNALTSGRVDAIFDILPHIDLFLSKYGSDDFMEIGPVNEESGIAFAFPLNTPYLEMFSRAVINVTESVNMIRMKTKYLGFSMHDQTQSNQAPPQSLGVTSFIGLFTLMAIVTIFAVVVSEILLRDGNDKVGVGQKEKLNTTNHVDVSRQLQERLPSIRRPLNIDRKGRSIW
ncbi:glutamate receptor 3.1-like [Rutidosis leptorrhynchoides]|uniref:glutamate receptor 3.1-like n=1 Tax=Rutidosis leptorrhynchoides TaxID=125765 RepID=UPI003A9961C3